MLKDICLPLRMTHYTGFNYANRRKDGTQQSTPLRTSRFCFDIFHWSAGVVHAFTTAVVLAVVLTYSQA
jgi:hypothetical protein